MVTEKFRLKEEANSLFLFSKLFVTHFILLCAYALFGTLIVLLKMLIFYTWYWFNKLCVETNTYSVTESINQAGVQWVGVSDMYSCNAETGNLKPKMMFYIISKL